MAFDRIRAAIVVAAGLLAVSPALAEQWRIVPESSTQIQYSFAPIVKRIAPAVVNVYASRVVEQSQSPFISDPFFRHFFGGPDLGAPTQRVQRSLGSGVIVDPAGIIITNHHVIANSDEIKVALSDRREFDCEVVLSDQRTDLAVLRIKDPSGDLPFAEFGDSDQLEVGDIVLAIGDPFGVGQTVTSGIVSALARTQVGVSDYQFFIQTDAAINPGNSGGALVDMTGNLVGINASIYTRSGGSIGVGFAIPVNMVKAVIKSSRGGGKVVRPWAGGDFQDVTADIAESLGFDRPQGVLVVGLHPQSPLAGAGLKRGDVILTIDGKPVGDAQELDYRLATRAVGETASLSYSRARQTYQTKVELIAAPEDPPRQETLVKGRNPFAGLVVVNISPAVAEELSLPVSAQGVVVSDVRGAIAAQVGFRKGDILVEVNGEKVANVDALGKILTRETSSWAFSVNRGGQVLSMRLGG
jgi:Do/DeqQ family serine protease